MEAHFPVKFLYTLLFFVLAAGPRPGHAFFRFDDDCRQAYLLMVRLQFDEAQRKLAAASAAQPDNFIPEYVASYIDFLTAFISEVPADYEVLRARRSTRLDRLDREDHDSPYFRLIRAELFLQTAIVRVKNKEYIASAYEFRKAYKLLESNARRFPDFVPNKKCLGILHALIGYVPSNYKWLTRLLGFRGTIPQGLGELHTLFDASQSDPALSYLYDETAVMLMFLEFHLKKDNKSAMALAARIEADDPGPLQLFSILSIYLYSGRNDRSIALLSAPRPPGEYPFYYLDFMHGLALLNKLDPAAAGFFRTYIDHFQGNSFIKASYQKLAWIALVQGDTAGYRRNLERVLEHGNVFTDEDKHARREAERAGEGHVPNVYLLQSRLLFDGGYFRKSLAVLAGKDIAQFPSFGDQLEYTYRLARVYDKMERRDLAMKYYEQTVRNGEAYEFYFAANAALYLGLLHENAGRRDDAVTWYRRCLAMRDHDYQNSIDQRAEAGLNRLGAQH